VVIDEAIELAKHFSTEQSASFVNGVMDAILKEHRTLTAPANSLQVMAFFSKTLDKLKGALRKTVQVLNTDVRTLFVPGRQINDEFLTEIEERLIQADMGWGMSRKLSPPFATAGGWKIRNAEEALGVMREQLLANWPPADRELKFAASGPTVILVAGINGAGKPPASQNWPGC